MTNVTGLQVAQTIGGFQILHSSITYSMPLYDINGFQLAKTTDS
jgi:hypothetical protein